MKYVVVGTSHFGYEAVQTILKNEPNAEIHLYERGAGASFMGWGSQSYLDGTSKALSELHFANEESYRSQGINIHCNSDVIKLNTEEKYVVVKTPAGEEKQSYDKLLLSPGGVAVKPPFEGIELENIHTFRGPEDTQAVYDCMQNSKKAVVVGGGYIGLEVAESYAKQGIDVTIVDFAPRILNTYLDQELTDILTEEGAKHNLKVRGGEKVLSFKGENGKVTSVVTDKGEYEADTVIVSVGVRPDASWLSEELEMTERGFVVTNEYLETSAKDVYAGGDSTILPYAPTRGELPIALATLARRQGVVAALNAMGQKTKMPAVNGTSALSFFDYKFVSTGLSQNGVGLYDGKVASKYVEERIYPDFMRKENNLVHMKIYFDEDTHRILGAQFMSKHDISCAIAALSIAISSEWTLEQLALADIFFQPEFDRPWHFINVLAMAALDYKLGGADKLLF